MTTKKSLATRPPNDAARDVGAREEQDFFGPPPLIPGEDPAACKALLGRLSAAVQPRGVLEEIWVRDVVDLEWDVLRLRRLKAYLLRAAAHIGVEKIIEPLVGWQDAPELSEEWAGTEKSGSPFVRGGPNNVNARPEA